jgi:hypothetical protein
LYFYAPVDGRLREMMTELVDRCTVVVQRYGGTVATAAWRNPLASRGISRGPRKCSDGGHPGKAAHLVLKQTTSETSGGRPEPAPFAEVELSRKSVSEITFSNLPFPYL